MRDRDYTAKPEVTRGEVVSASATRLKHPIYKRIHLSSKQVEALACICRSEMAGAMADRAFELRSF